MDGKFISTFMLKNELDAPYNRVYIDENCFQLYSTNPSVFISITRYKQSNDKSGIYICGNLMHECKLLPDPLFKYITNKSIPKGELAKIECLIEHLRRISANLFDVSAQIFSDNSYLGLDLSADISKYEIVAKDDEVYIKGKSHIYSIGVFIYIGLPVDGCPYFRCKPENQVAMMAALGNRMAEIIKNIIIIPIQNTKSSR